MTLTLSNIHAGYGRFAVLHGLELAVPDGDLRLVVGPNGAGKTTMCRAIFGLVQPTSGKIFAGDTDITRMPPRALLDRRIAYVPQEPSIFPQLTVEDNLEMGLFQSGGGSDRGLLQQVFDRFDLLRKRRRSLARTLSGGERRLLELARALMVRPRMLILDEPSLGLSPIMMDLILREIVEINNQGVTVILVEQRVKAAAPVSKSISVLRLGRIVKNGTARDARDEQWIASALYDSNDRTERTSHG